MRTGTAQLSLLLSEDALENRVVFEPTRKSKILILESFHPGDSSLVTEEGSMQISLKTVNYLMKGINKSSLLPDTQGTVNYSTPQAAKKIERELKKLGFTKGEHYEIIPQDESGKTIVERKFIGELAQGVGKLAQSIWQSLTNFLK